jgi:RNA polymerase sigma-70 factor (ECF subfamily)
MIETLRFGRTGSRTVAPPDPGELRALCEGEVLRYAWRRVGQRQDAEDIAVETFAAALAALPGYRGTVAPRPWLLGIARRKVADTLRRRTRRAETSLPETMESDDSPEDDALRAEAIATIRGLVDTLPELQRDALLLQTLEDLSIPEIAQVLGKSVSATNSLLGRARQTLKQRGGAYFSEGEL